MILQAIYLYPVKSLGGIAVKGWPLDEFGLKFDRRWMIVNPEGRFLTQRQHPAMAKIATQIDPDRGRLKLIHPQVGEVKVPLPDDEQARTPVSVWRSHVNAVPVSESVDQWLSKAIGVACRLVWFPEDEIRQVNPNHARKGEKTAFSDGYPFLLTSQASLDDLNGRLREPVPMIRFRPNLVVSGCQPYAEDTWARITIADLPFRVVKPCARCVVTTIDPERGARVGREPLETLFAYRRHGKEAWFGQNCIHEQQGDLQVGDPVRIEGYKAQGERLCCG